MTACPQQTVDPYQWGLQAAYHQADDLAGSLLDLHPEDQRAVLEHLRQMLAENDQALQDRAAKGAK